MSAKNIDFNEFRYEDVTAENVGSLTPEQQRILKLEKRCEALEGEMLSCLRFIRYQAQKEERTLGGSSASEPPKA